MVVYHLTIANNIHNTTHKIEILSYSLISSEYFASGHPFQLDLCIFASPSLSKLEFQENWEHFPLTQWPSRSNMCIFLSQGHVIVVMVTKMSKKCIISWTFIWPSLMMIGWIRIVLLIFDLFLGLHRNEPGLTYSEICVEVWEVRLYVVNSARTHWKRKENLPFCASSSNMANVQSQKPLLWDTLVPSPDILTPRSPRWTFLDLDLVQ